MYQHTYLHATRCELPPGKVVCVGRNYADHIAELNNDTPEEPLLFIKGNNSLAAFRDRVFIPEQGLCHNELELTFLIGEALSCASSEQALEAVAGVGLALDLTLRDKQTELKAKGHPWERAKAFDGSCPVSEFVPVGQLDLQQNLQFALRVNDDLRQEGNSGHMIWSWPELISHISAIFSLYPGDLVLTGTPKGVGPLYDGDNLQASLNDKLYCEAKVQQGRAR